MAEIEIKQVIFVTSTIGRGIEGDPIRPYVQLFNMDGKELLNIGDYTKDSTRTK